MSLSIPQKLIFYVPPHSPQSLQMVFSEEFEGKVFATCIFKDKKLHIDFAEQQSTLTLNEFVKHNDFYKKMIEVVTLYELLGQRNYSSPSSFGLMPQKLSKALLNSQFRNLQSSSIFCKELTQKSDRTLWSGSYGWFPPDRDPQEFGSLFLAPVFISGKNYWALLQIGVEKIIEKVAWEQENEIKELASKCQEDPELMLTINALQDSEELKKRTAEYEYKKQVLNARKVFAPKEKQIRPKLTEKHVQEIGEKVFGKKTITRVSTYDLRPYSVFGIKTIKEERARPVWAAACVHFSSIQAEKVFLLDHMYELLHEILAENNLGVAVKHIQYDPTRSVNKNSSSSFPRFGGHPMVPAPPQKPDLIKGRTYVQDTFIPKIWVVKDKNLLAKYSNILVDHGGDFLPTEESYEKVFHQLGIDN